MMNVHRGHPPLPPQDHPCPPHGFSLGPRLHPCGPVVGLQPRPSKAQRDLSAEEQQELRRKINSRERRRMQDLNMAMDALREVMVPYASSPASSQTPGRRLSKISTLVLARNYILLLGSSLQEMRRLLGECSAPVPRLLLSGAWPVASSPPQILLTQDSFVAQTSSTSSNGKCPVMAPPSGAVEAMLVPGQWGSTRAGAGGSLCPCGVCRLSRFNHNSTSGRFPK